MTLKLPELPYSYDALEPHISRTTLEIHHGRHHRAYVEKADALADAAGFAGVSLERIVLQTKDSDSDRSLFANAAQAWNHAFYWRSLRPQGGGRPRGEIADRIDADFGSYENFATRFAAAAVDRFGSGWAWLVLNGDTLEIMTTSNAGTPITNNRVPLLVIDVWEHAYYLDYQNLRLNYASAVIDGLLDWGFANRNLNYRDAIRDELAMAGKPAGDGVAA